MQIQFKIAPDNVQKFFDGKTVQVVSEAMDYTVVTITSEHDEVAFSYNSRYKRYDCQRTPKAPCDDAPMSTPKNKDDFDIKKELHKMVEEASEKPKKKTWFEMVEEMGG